MGKPLSLPPLPACPPSPGSSWLGWDTPVLEKQLLWTLTGTEVLVHLKSPTSREAVGRDDPFLSLHLHFLTLDASLLGLCRGSGDDIPCMRYPVNTMWIR